MQNKLLLTTVSCNQGNRSVVKTTIHLQMMRTCVLGPQKLQCSIGNTRMLNKLTKVSHTIQLFIHATKNPFWVTTTLFLCRYIHIYIYIYITVKQKCCCDKKYAVSVECCTQTCYSGLVTNGATQCSREYKKSLNGISVHFNCSFMQLKQQTSSQQHSSSWSGLIVKY